MTDAMFVTQVVNAVGDTFWVWASAVQDGKFWLTIGVVVASFCFLKEMGKWLRLRR